MERDDVDFTVEELAREALSLLAKRPAGLISDIDGTLSQISDDPAEAVVDPQIKASLISLVDHVDVLAVVTGRAALEAARLVDIPGVSHLGNHGMERLVSGEVLASSAALAYSGALERVMTEARSKIVEPLVLFENKGVSGSVHYRNTPDPALAHEQILAVLAPLVEREGLRLTQGRMVVEIRPPVDINKGTALTELVQEFGLRSVIFMGDDVTDVDAMQAVAELRRASQIDGMTIGVVGPETPAVVTEESDQVVSGIEGIADFLARLVQLVTEQPGQRNHESDAEG